MKKEFSEDIKKFMAETYPDCDIYAMDLQELKKFREEVKQKREEYNLLELSQKVLANAAYGSCASNKFYFYNLNLAGDITGECRELTKTMWHNLENFFHETIWERKDLWEQFDFALDESKHDWYRHQTVSCYSDTDSVYTTYETFFKCFTKEYQEKYNTVEKQIEWILKFNQEFLDKQNTKWCEEIYNPRHGKNVHEFELETVSQSQIILKKKKYLKGLRFNKGKFLDKPKMSGTGIEIIKSTTPKLCREMLTELTRSLMFDYKEENRDEYIMFFNNKLQEYRKQFYNAPIEDISQSIGIGAYKKYVIADEDQLILGKQCPVSVQAIARYNHLAYKNGQSDKRQYSGKIKYYNIILNNNMKKPEVGYFGYPAGEIPDWAPKMDKRTQWRKNIIDPINRFLEVMQIPLANETNTIQLELF